LGDSLTIKSKGVVRGWRVHRGRDVFTEGEYSGSSALLSKRSKGVIKVEKEEGNQVGGRIFRNSE